MPNSFPLNEIKEAAALLSGVDFILSLFNPIYKCLSKHKVHGVSLICIESKKRRGDKKEEENAVLHHHLS